MAEDTCAEPKLTLAELCTAIAEGRVDYTLRNGCYQMWRRDVQRLRLDLEEPRLPLSLYPAACDMLGDSVGAS
ncbi:MAG TPA: hypothetical protein VKQ30_11260 [Ktedonobacterales bacterium]|nr:hypothetical protein [Ktedonobacterales bacterium]